MCKALLAHAEADPVADYLAFGTNAEYSAPNQKPGAKDFPAE